MNDAGLLLFLVILIVLFVGAGVLVSRQTHTKYPQGKHALVAVCTRGIYALCFAEGYVILTESLEQARAVCADLHLDLHPYWSQIVHLYPNRAEALANMKELEAYLGPSVSSFATLAADGLSIRFQGYISTIGQSGGIYGK